MRLCEPIVSISFGCRLREPARRVPVWQDWRHHLFRLSLSQRICCRLGVAASGGAKPRHHYVEHLQIDLPAVRHRSNGANQTTLMLTLFASAERWRPVHGGMSAPVWFLAAIIHRLPAAAERVMTSVATWCSRFTRAVSRLGASGKGAESGILSSSIRRPASSSSP